MSAIAPSGPLRWGLAVVLSASGVKLLGASNGVLLAVIVVGLAIGAGLVELNRRARTAAQVVAAPALERV
jgi:hypothetical protein